MSATRGQVVVDTSVFASRLTPSGKLIERAYQPLLEGRPAALSFATVAELRFGALRAGWGEKRQTHVAYELSRVEVVWPGPKLVETYALLRTWCVTNGHGLGHKHHEADRWIAAAAIFLGVPLVANDAIFLGVAGLEVLTKLPRATD